jgi:hypothetical protein
VVAQWNGIGPQSPARGHTRLTVSTLIGRTADGYRFPAIVDTPRPTWRPQSWAMPSGTNLPLPERGAGTPEPCGLSPCGAAATPQPARCSPTTVEPGGSRDRSLRHFGATIERSPARRQGRPGCQWCQVAFCVRVRCSPSASALDAPPTPPGCDGRSQDRSFAIGEGPGVTALATTAVFTTGARMAPTLPTRAGLSGMRNPQDDLLSPGNHPLGRAASKCGCRRQ